MVGHDYKQCHKVLLSSGWMAPAKARIKSISPFCAISSTWPRVAAFVFGAGSNAAVDH